MTQRTLQLDNGFSSDSSCFIVSKTDSSLNIPRYIRNHPNVESDLVGIVKMEKDYNEMLVKAREYCAVHRETQATNKILLDKLRKDYKNLPEAGKRSQVGRPKKRKANEMNGSSGMYPALVLRSLTVLIISSV